MTTNESSVDLSRSPRAVRLSAAGVVLAAGTLLALAVPSSALAQGKTVCGPEVKLEVAKALTEIDTVDDKAGQEAQLYEKYQFCLEDAQMVPTTFFIAARQCGAFVSNLGSLFYEEMSCAGYDPQRRQFAAPVKIKQTFGFGGAPLPGSREYVLSCVADAGGTLRPVSQDSVHLADEMFGEYPTWQFAVIANANQNLQTVYPMGGETRRARSILSWGFSPNNNCNFQPIWGNALNYRIRLDQ